MRFAAIICGKQAVDRGMKSRPEHFSVEDFRVPRDYLRLIAGKAASEAMLAATNDNAGDNAGDDDSLSSITFVNLCLHYFRSTYRESLANGPEVRFGAFGLIVSAAGQGLSFADALERTVGAIEILRPELSAKVTSNPTSLALSLEPRQGGPAAEVGVEFLAMSLQCAFRWLTGRRLRPVQVRAAEPAARHEVSMLNILACPVVRRGTGVTIYYDRADGARPLQPQKYDCWASKELPEFRALLREFADKINRHEHVAESPLVARVDELLTTGVHLEAEVAARLHMSPASLRRHLSEYGTSFRARLDRMKRDTVEALLQTDMPLEAIAADTGFSDVRSLRRACVRWFGSPPASYRRSGPKGT
ncbi:putative AraC family transcriptional regulator [Sphingobium herbicidovorans NBRC 16415]|uniref:AraC family transcriptional regulator n=2 Tax=Alphaproteobacteria TaxID=28211 RepID=A0A086P8U8_SPHHM|nr:putative AraC family transcriptional regulator [Sphingobium herbicidovorans NBRC 16415]